MKNENEGVCRIAVRDNGVTFTDEQIAMIKAIAKKRERIATVIRVEGKDNAPRAMCKLGLCTSMSEARRITQGFLSVKRNREQVSYDS